MARANTSQTGSPKAGTALGAPGRALRTTNLRVQLAESLRERLNQGEWHEGDQLPTEAELSAEYGVSRSTVRSALHQLETLGLTITRHGMGTFVSPYGRAIKSGLQELRSMTDTIKAHGMKPAMDYHLVEFRGADEDEAQALAIEPGTRVLSTQRAVLADDTVVAYSYETIPANFLPHGLEASEVKGLFSSLLDKAGVVPNTAVAEIGAASGPAIGWGERDPDMVYVDLRQVHYDSSAQPVVQSRTYFQQGRFEFS